MASDVAIKLDIDLDLSNIRKEGQAIGNILQRALNKNTRTKALDSLERQIGKTREQLQKMEEKINNIINNPTEHVDWMSEDFQKAYAEARKLEDEVKRIVDEARKIKPDASLSEIRQNLEGKTRTIGATRGSRKTQVTGIRFSERKDLETLKQYEKALADMQKATENFQGTEKFEMMNTAIENTRDKLRSLAEEYRRVSLESGNVIQNGLQPIINFNQEISQTMGAFSQAFGPYLQIATTALSAYVAVLKTAVSLMGKLGQASIAAFKPLVSLAKGAATAIGKMFDNIKKHNETTMKNLWRNVLRYGIGVRSMYFLIRKIRAAIGDVINELSRQIPEVNAQMSAFQTAVNGLKGALATAFQPILTAILPALTALINAVSRAIAVVGKFIALLTGQNFVYAATATQVDYAASLDKTGKSAKKAKKELEGYLSPIDEINKYQDKNKDNDSGGDGGGDYTLKKVPIDDWMKDFWDKIKKAWEHADFFDLGKMLGDKLAKMLAMIPWAEIRAKARQLGRSLATLLNGIMHGEFDGKSLATYIGQTIAGAINTAFEFVDSFVSDFEWDTLGKSIMEAIAGALDNIDWNLITGALSRLGTGIGNTLAAIFNDTETWAKAGEALARGINALIYMVFNIFNEVEGPVVGAAISRFLNKFIEWIDSGAFVTTCNEIMRDILDALIVAVATTHWDELGAKLAEIISGIDFAGIFKRYARLASVIIDAILDLLEEFLNGLTPDKLTEIGESIAEFINNIDFQPKRFAEVANRLIQALFTIIKEAVSGENGIDWKEIGENIGTALKNIDWKGIISGAVEILNGIKDGLWDLLDSALYNWFGEIGRDAIMGFVMALKVLVGTLLAPALGPFKQLIDAVKAVFRISSPSKVFQDIGLDIVAGFINGIKTIVDKAKQVWNDLKTTTISIFNGIWNGIKTVINSIIAGVEAMANGVIKGINFAVGALNTLKIDPPEWIKSKYGIGAIGFNIPTLNEISIPRLAQGAVIPPNREFMAMLGDQKSGTNIETPLSTMIEAFNTALSQNGGAGGVKQITFVLPDRREVAKYAIEGGRVIQTSTGRNPFELA